MDRDRFFALSPELLATAEPDDRFHELSPAWTRCLGWTLDELRARPWIEFVHPDDVAATRALRQSGNQAVHFVNRYRHKDGSYRWLSWSGSRMVDGTSYAVARDITEAKRTEEALRESEERYRELFDNAKDLNYTHDFAGNFTAVNNAAERISGYSRAEALQMNIAQIVPPEYLDAVLPWVLRAGADTTTATYELEIIAKDGRRVPLEVNSRVIFRAGVPVGVQGIARDLTEQKRIEAALQTQREQLREDVDVAAALARVGSEMISSLATPVVLERLCRLTTEVLPCDASHIYLWQPGEEAYVPMSGHGHTPEQWEAMRVMKFPLSLVRPLHERLEHEGLVQVRRADARGRRALAMFRPGGTSAIMFVALRRAGKLIGVLGASNVSRDESFTPQQLRIARGIAQLGSFALENARLVEELERADSFRSDFVAIMSHELRNPLTVIMGYHELLLDGTFGAVPAEQADILRRANKNALELLDLVNATLDLSRFESRQVPLTQEVVAIAKLLDDVGAEMQAVSRKKHLAVQWEVSSEPITLSTDPVKLRMVLKNLIGNAVKFTDEGQITVCAHARDGGVEFRVSDTGIGIPSEALELIFEPFRQVDHSPARRSGGAGLGLYIVRRLVEMLSGTITLDSEVGKGSTFRVWLPRRASRAPASRIESA
jgi:PAS domain S-box-containing protein